MHAMGHAEIEKRFNTISPFLDEKRRRVWAATEARHIGYGGVSVVSRATGLSRKTIRDGVYELANPNSGSGRQRRAGSGRKKVTENDPKIRDALEILIFQFARFKTFAF